MKEHRSKAIRTSFHPALFFSSFRSSTPLWRLALSTLLALATLTGVARAGGVYVPNYSFETPGVPDAPPYAQPELDYWEQTAQPNDYNPSNAFGFYWFELVGAFYNDPEDGAYIDNCTGNQCAYIFSVPQVGLFQDYTSSSITQEGPTYAFNATFKPGHPYYVTVALIGGGGGMSTNAALQVSLYYRDASNNMVTVSSRTVTNDPTLFPTNTHFVDFQLDVGTVQPTDPWAGQNIGIQFLSLADTNNEGGYWDIDNVRLVEGINVPNYSFETPAVPDVPPYAQPELDYWEQTAQPNNYNPSNAFGFYWFELVGAFYNDPGDGAYIYNCDRNQCAYIFSVPQNGLFQDYTSSSITEGGPTYAFNATFNPGKGYSLSAGLIGGGGGMPTGAALQMSLYYRDASSNMVTVASTNITNTPDLFPTDQEFINFQLQVPGVKATDPWAGQNIGIQFLSLATTNNEGGYWDIDNVQLSETVAPALSNPAQTAGQFNFTLLSEPGFAFNVLSSTNIATPGTNWISLDTVTNVTGSTPFTDPATNLPQRFYRLQEL